MQVFCQLNASFATSFKNVCELTLITWLRLKHRWTYSLKNQNITEYFDSNANSIWSGGCHPHPSIITLMSKKLLFQPYLYLTTKDQNMTINTPLSSNQIDCYNGSEYCNGNKGPGLCMDVWWRCSHANCFTFRRKSSGVFSCCELR